MSDASEIVLPPGVPEEARPVLQEVGYFVPDTLHPGDKIAPITLTSLHGTAEVVLGEIGRQRPMVLIFGSYT